MMNGLLQRLLQYLSHSLSQSLLQLWRRLLSLARRGRYEREMEEEMRFHLEMQIEQNLAAGMAAEEARYSARRQFGNQTWLKEASREMWSLNLIETMIQDLRYGVRMLLKKPGFTLIAVFTLALGIGASTAIFSVVDAVLFRPLPFTDPDRLVEIWQQTPGRQYTIPYVSLDAFQEWRSQTSLFESLEAYIPRSFTLTGGLEPESIRSHAVSPGLFAMLGVNPRLGRPFQVPDAEPGNDHVALISDGLWKKHFGGDPGAIGKTMMFNDQPYTVIGVMPPKFKFPYGKVDLWVPLTLKPADKQSRFQVVARLRERLAIPTAQSALDALASRLAKEKSDPRGWGAKLSRLDERRVNPGPRRALLILFGAVGFVLLLACANAANLTLARAAKRRGEIAVRLAFGAGRWRIVRQLLTESMLLALVGGLMGVLLAWLGVALLAKFVPDEFTFMTINEISIENRVLFFTLGVTLLTGVGFGLAPALKTSRPDLQPALKGAAGQATSDRSQNRLHNALVIAEVALSLVLLIGAGLMMRSFLRIAAEPPGFDTSNLIAADLSLPQRRYQTLAQEEDFFNGLKALITAIPGVESATAAEGAPPGGGGISFDLNIEIEGRAPEPRDPKLILPFSSIDPEYFRTLRIPILQGRAFGPEDTINAPPAMIINEEMARRYWPNENPVGKRIRFSKDDKWMTVVGVVGDVKIGKPGDGFSRMEVYYPWSQRSQRAYQRTLIVRAIADAGPLIAAVKSAIWTLDKDQPVRRINTVEDLLSDALAEPRFYLFLFGCFAGLTLLLVSMGIYGVMSYSVTQRTHEIGIRMALGADRAAVLTLTLKRGMSLALAGVGIGIAASIGLSRLMAALLFGMPATDPLTFGGVTALLIGVALLACYIPARRAASLDPLVSLRVE